MAATTTNWNPLKNSKTFAIILPPSPILCKGEEEGDTNYFSIEQGVKQGCNLSHLLLYINNLPRSLSHPKLHCMSPLTVSCLMFADDIVIFSNDPNELQYSLTQLDVVCETSLLRITMN